MLMFDAPARSPAHLALREAAQKALLDVDTLRNLLWLLNAHPRLLGHAQILRNLHRIFVSPIFSRDAVTWASSWTNQLDNWIEQCTWCWDSRVTLSRRNGLEEFSKDPNKHPLMFQGIVRHPVTASLWNEAEPAQQPGLQYNLGLDPYSMLQGHVFAAYAESRFQLTTLEQYETHDGPDEYPIAPMRCGQVSVALRELSFSRFANLLSRLPQAASTLEFAERLLSHNPSYDALSVGDQVVASNYFRRLTRFFGRFLAVRDGYRPTQKMRPSWRLSGGGGGSPHPGYIALPASDELLVDGPTAETGDDLDTPRKSGKTYFSSGSGSDYKDRASFEASGLSPNETVEEIATLVSADQLRAELQAIRQQRLALDMRAQRLPYDYANLTPDEIGTTWRVADQAIQSFKNSPAPSDVERIEALAAIALKLSLAYGQNIGSVTNLRWASAVLIDNELSGDFLDHSLPCLLFNSSSKGEGWQFGGMMQPPLMPDYATELAAELEDIDPDSISPFVLPDHLGIGTDLAALFPIGPEDRSSVFEASGPSLRKALGGLIDRCHNERITPTKLTGVLASIICQQTGDPLLAWLVQADQGAANEPRLFYTRHSTEKVQTTYFQAARRIGKFVGHRVEKPKNNTTYAPSTVVGARFVISRESVRQLIQRLKTDLIAKDLNRESREAVAIYHNCFMLYVLLYQSLSTSIRAISTPTQLYKDWEHFPSRHNVLTGLSDKESQHYEKSRLVVLPAGLREQFKHLRNHHLHLKKQPGFRLKVIAPAIRVCSPLYFFDDQGTATPPTPDSVAKALLDFFDYPLPANFHRAFLRTELREMGCPVEILDAFLGHFNQGENPFGLFSTFDYSTYAQIVGNYLDRLHQEIGLLPIQSRAIPPELRRGR